jgi:hypothetical protein
MYKYRTRPDNMNVSVKSGSARYRQTVYIVGPPVFRRFADSLAPHQNLVRAKTAAEPAGIKVVHVYGIAL